MWYFENFLILLVVANYNHEISKQLKVFYKPCLTQIMKSKHENTEIEFDSSSDGHLIERTTLT